VDDALIPSACDMHSVAAFQVPCSMTPFFFLPNFAVRGLGCYAAAYMYSLYYSSVSLSPVHSVLVLLSVSASYHLSNIVSLARSRACALSRDNCCLSHAVPDVDLCLSLAHNPR
jgi:hypothetical protein